jgi:YVTN family beta-propeller protein
VDNGARSHWPWTGIAILVLALTALLGLAGRSAAPPGATIVMTEAASIPLPDVEGRIDHMAVDFARRRLIVAELGNGTVDVLDIETRARLHRFADLRDPQGVAYAAKGDLIVIASAGDGTVRLYRAADFAPAGVLALGDDADNVRIDPLMGNIVVGYGSGGLAIIDPTTRTKIAEIPLGAHPEGFQLDGGTAFVNLPDAGRIAVVDVEARREVASWRTTGRRSNFPMALATDGSVAVVFRDPSALVAFDRRDGAVRQTVPVCGDADDVFFDSRLSRYYVSCGSGRLDVIALVDGAMRKAGSLQTASGARTSLFVPELDRLFIARRAELLGFGSGAAILVFEP